MTELTELLKQRDQLRAKMQALQKAIVNETGALDQREYRRRLVDAGLIQALDEVEDEIKRLTK